MEQPSGASGLDTLHRKAVSMKNTGNGLKM